MLIIKKIAKGKTTKSIFEKIKRHVVTKKVTVTRFFLNPSKRKPWSDCGGLNNCHCVR